MKVVYKPDMYLYCIALWVVLGIFSSSMVYAGFVQSKLTNGHFVKDTLILLGILFAGYFWHFFERVYMSPYTEGQQLIIPGIIKSIRIPIVSITILQFLPYFGKQYMKLIYTQKDQEKSCVLKIDDYNTKTITDFKTALVAVQPTIQIETNEQTQKFLERRAAMHLKAPVSIGGWILFATRWIIPISLVTYIFLLIIT